MRFAHPELAHLALLFPVIAAAALFLYGRRRREAAQALGDAPLVRRLAGAELGPLPRWRTGVLVAAAAALGVAAAGPSWGTERVPGGNGGVEVVLVVDASNSMLVRDVSPDRMELQRALARLLLGRLPDARVGLVVFAGRGYLVSPLTRDHAALNLYLDALAPDVVTQGGSSLSDAIRQATDLLVADGGEGSRGAAVLITDGDALEEREEVLRAAEDAAAARVVVHTVGVGSRRGGPVPDLSPGTGEQRGWKREPSGDIAVSRLDADLLRDVARRTGATYSAGDVRRLARALAEGTAGGAREEVTAAGNRYEWFVALALVLLAAEAVLERWRPKWWRRRSAGRRA